MVEKIAERAAWRKRTHVPLGRTLLTVALVICATRLAGDAPCFIKAPIWVYTEPVPGKLPEESKSTQKPPEEALDDLARFVLSGMVYGWNFSYSPGDITRNVEEYFSFEPIRTVEKTDPRFSVTELAEEYPRIRCWAQFELDDETARRRTYWDSTLFRNARGRGQGDRSAEMEGVRQAYANALRTAIREHVRKQEKNKPKEIHGEAILRESPTLAVSAGLFVADVKITVNIREIIPYTAF
jgi:hypothetical protein